MQHPRRARPPAPPRDATPPAAGSGPADLDAHIARLLDDAPPLTSAQRDQLALILRRPRPPCRAQAPRQPQPPEPDPAQPARPGARTPRTTTSPAENARQRSPAAAAGPPTP